MEEKKLEQQKNSNTASNSNISAGRDFHIGNTNTYNTYYSKYNPNTPQNSDILDMKNIRKLIANNQIKEVFEILLSHQNKINNDNNNEILLLSKRWNKCQKEERLGIITSNEEDAKTGKIVYDLLNFLQELEN